MSQPKPLFYLAAIGIFLFASIGQAQTTPVAVIQTPIQIDANRVAFSPDGKWVVTVDQDGRDHTLWDVKTGRKVAELPAGGTSRGPSGPDIVFSPDGRYLASFDASQMAVPTIVWDLETYEAASLGKLDAPNQVRSSIAKWTPAEVRGLPPRWGG